MNAIISFALGHARTVLAGLFFLLLAGTIAYVTIPKESDPDINIPIVYVSLSLEGISPEDAERLLLRPMETELRVIEGKKEMRSNAYQGGANVVLEFEAGFDVDQALEDVREAVDDARPELPDEADEPTVSEVNFALFPVLIVSLSGEMPERTLLRLARDLQDRVEGIPQVLEAKIGGDREEQVEILIDPSVLESYGIDAAAVIDLVGRNNRLVAAGSLDTGDGRFPVKVPGLFESLDDILDMPIKAVGDSVVKFRDVAEIRRTFKDPEGFARINGQTAISLEVSKRSGENIIETIAAVKAVVEAERAYWPPQVDVTYSQDRSTDIRNMLADLQNNVISAILLVMIICVGALGLRSASLVGIAVPGSFLTGILVISFMGLTVNIVVLFSLILATGMLVDGAIVVTEFAEREMARGVDRKQAYGQAARRMAWPITASTATTLAAFMPLLFWPGVVGEFMVYLPITLLAVLTASLAMALVFVPTLGSLIGKPNSMVDGSNRNQETLDVLAIPGFVGAYLRLLNRALKRPLAVVIGAFWTLIGLWAFYGAFGHGVEFFPEVEPEQASLQIHARGNLSIFERDTLVQEVEDIVLELNRETGEFDSIYSRSQSQRGNQDEEAEDVIGIVQLEFADWQTRRTADEILTDIRVRGERLAGIRIEPRKQESGPPVGKPVQIRLTSRDPDLIAPAAGIVRDKLSSIDGLIDVEDSRPLPGVEWELRVDRAQAAKFDADVTVIGNTVKLITNGMQFDTYRPDDADDEIDIVARFPRDYRTLDQLDEIRISTGEGVMPLSNFITRAPEPKVGEIARIDGERVLLVKADAKPGVLVDAKVQEIQQWLIEEKPLDPRVRVTFEGEDKEQAEAMAFLSKAFGAALFIMAVILVTQFNSFYSAFLILFAVVMSTVGVLLGLLITSQPFGIVMTGIGVIALAGIVVNNNIVLIDTYDHIRKQEPDPIQAILQTGAQRLRPVILTTVTTILGLIPMMLGANVDFVGRSVSIGAPSTQWWTQLASAIVFGLAFATILTLVVTPSALLVRARFSAWRARRRQRREMPGMAAPAE